MQSNPYSSRFAGAKSLKLTKPGLVESRDPAPSKHLIACCVAHYVPEPAQMSPTKTKNRPLRTNNLKNKHPIPKPLVGSSTLPRPTI